MILDARNFRKDKILNTDVCIVGAVGVIFAFMALVYVSVSIGASGTTFPFQARLESR